MFRYYWKMTVSGRKSDYIDYSYEKDHYQNY